jgi:predicted hotdog family 3-hydroxylacyl-ACP dehydratase
MKPAYRIDEVLPHAGPMLLLDELLDVGAEHICCGVNVRRETQFCDGANGVPSWVGLEYMAQTMCAFSGVEEVQAGGKPTIALLLGSRRYQCETPWFALGSRLLIRAELQLRDENDLVAFHCSIHESGHLLARGDVKAYRPRDVMSVIRGERAGGPGGDGPREDGPREDGPETGGR